jgi:prepilin-type N-terminal cleavage/methylation domain-containing protein
MAKLSKKGFTLIELLVVIAIIALLMSILMPSLAKVRQQTKKVVCQANLRQWGITSEMYLLDNNNSFWTGRAIRTSEQDQSNYWIQALRPYFGNQLDLCLCPSARKFNGSNAYDSAVLFPKEFGFPTWRYAGDYASYAENTWVSNPDNADKRYWRTRNVKKTSMIPVMIDSYHIDSMVQTNATAPAIEGLKLYNGSNEMHKVCINRHNYHVNAVFMDASVRPVPLKYLWTLRWNRRYVAVEQDWPAWMQKLKDPPSTDYDCTQ